MKNLFIALLALVLCVSLCACSGSPSGSQPSESGHPSAGSDAPIQSDPSSSEPVSGNVGVPSAEPEPSQEPSADPQPVPPSEPFDPLGTWVWEGNPNLTLTLNEDGTAVYNDPEAWLIPYNWYIDDNVQATWVYNESEQQIVITYVDPDNEWSIDPQSSAVTGDLGYYMIDGGEHDHSFIRAEHFDDAHTRFLDPYSYNQDSFVDKEVVLGQTYPLVSWSDAATITVTDAALAEFSYQDRNYLGIRFYFTLNTTEEIYTLKDFFDYYTMFSADASYSSGQLTPYDLSGNEITSLPAGSTLEGYCEAPICLANGGGKHLLRWFGGPNGKIGINGIFCFVVPSDTIDYK